MFPGRNYVNVWVTLFVKHGEIFVTCSRTSHSELQDLCLTQWGITAHTAAYHGLNKQTKKKEKLTLNGIMITIKYRLFCTYRSVSTLMKWGKSPSAGAPLDVPGEGLLCNHQRSPQQQHSLSEFASFSIDKVDHEEHISNLCLEIKLIFFFNQRSVS